MIPELKIQQIINPSTFKELSLAIQISELAEKGNLSFYEYIYVCCYKNNNVFMKSWRKLFDNIYFAIPLESFDIRKEYPEKTLCYVGLFSGRKFYVYIGE